METQRSRLARGEAFIHNQSKDRFCCQELAISRNKPFACDVAGLIYQITNSQKDLPPVLLDFSLVHLHMFLPTIGWCFLPRGRKSLGAAEKAWVGMSEVAPGHQRKVSKEMCVPPWASDHTRTGLGKQERIVDAPDSLCGVPVAMRGGRVITLAQLETPIIPINMGVSYLMWRMVSLKAQLQPLWKIFY